MRDIKFLVQEPIAHRGLYNEKYPENSLGAFGRAIEQDYPIELDVQLTLDEQLVVFHDWRLERMTGANGKLANNEYKKIKNLKLSESGEGVPLLKEVLEIIDGKTPLIIEIKSQSYFDYKICEKIYDLLKEYNGTYAISSFNPFIVRWFTKNTPDIVRGQNFTDFRNKNIIVAFFKKMFLHMFWIISKNNPDFFACRANRVLGSWVVKIAKKRQKLLLAWGIEDKKEYDKIRSVIDNNFFDKKSW